jgi:hypothetical protein
MNLTKLLVAVMIPIFFSLTSYSQTDPGLGGGGDDTTDAPVAGGMEYLLAVGMLYGVNKLRGRKKISSYKEDAEADRLIDEH